MPQHRVNFLNSLVFIACGIFGFLSHYFNLGEYEQATLIPFVLGILLLVMTPSIKNGSVVIKKVVTALTFVFGSIVLYLLFKNMGSDQNSARKMIVLTLIALSSFASFGLYLSNWIDEKKKN